MICETTVSVIGLGKLGICLAATLASRGLKVWGYDADAKVMTDFASYQSAVVEPGLLRLLQEYRDNLFAACGIAEAVVNSSITFIVVPTPSKPDGCFDAKHVVAAAEEVGNGMRDRDTYHLVVVVSTLMPGQMQGEILPVLERTSGKTCGEAFGLCYNPEFVALGNVIQGMLHPEYVLIGQSDERAGEMLRRFYRDFIGSRGNEAIFQESFIDTEIAKLAINNFVAMRIAFANMLGSLCQETPGADAVNVLDMVQEDPRVGGGWLKAGTPFGGPCLPRDVQAMKSMIAENIGRVELARTVVAANLTHGNTLYREILKFCNPKSKIAILGLAYKSGTNVTDNSFGFKLADAISSRFIYTICYDPLVTPDTYLHQTTSIEHCLRDADVIVITTPDPVFQALEAKDFKYSATVFDCWRILENKLAHLPDLRYIPFGKGPT